MTINIGLSNGLLPDGIDPAGIPEANISTSLVLRPV